MNRFLTAVFSLILLLAGCTPSTPAVSLASPADGSGVKTLTPVLSWGGGPAGATYRLVIATDSNFQEVIFDSSNINYVDHEIPVGKLKADMTYYWRVLAKKGDLISPWSAAWSFHTKGALPDTGNIRISATLDGQNWAGALNFQVNGNHSDVEDTVPWSYTSIQPGTYTITYNFGGPSGATLADISPSPAQQLEPGGTVNFVLNFRTAVSSRINVSATLDGSPWSGNITYSIYGPYNDVDTIVPYTFNSVPDGTYTLTYNSGGPQNTALSDISPSASQVLAKGGEINYVLNFHSSGSSNLTVNAQYNGTVWSGPVQFSLSGPVSGSYPSVPLQLTGIPAGTYKITYLSGGPSGATLGGILPDSTLVISKGRSGGFTLNYYAHPQTGSISVDATLDGSAWSGAASMAISGPVQFSDYQLPRTHSGVQAGRYTVSYLGGGPAGAVFTGITPVPAQSLVAGGNIAFNLNFVSQPDTGTVTVNAYVDGKPWSTQIGSGPINFSLIKTGLADTEDTIPYTFQSLPSGYYTMIYNSGGPIGATLTGISPSPGQNLARGGSITFNLNFTGLARGYVTVDAKLNGSEWSGAVDYVVLGPYTQSGNFVSMTFDNAPQGSYSVQYRDGGPAGAIFTDINPRSGMLSPGRSLVFTIEYTSIMPGPVPNPTPEPGPMPGPVPNPTPEPGPMPGPVPNPTPEPGPMPGPIIDQNLKIE